MKYILLTVLIACAVFSCQKYQKATDDASGDLYYRGRAFLVNTVTNAPAKTLGNLTLYLGYPRDSANNAITSTKTDSAGYFVFQNLKKDTAYIIYGTYTEGGISYKVKQDVSIGSSVATGQIQLTLSQTLNGVEYTVTDINGGPVPGTAICYFTSFAVANDTCMGSVYRDTTNAVGKSTRLALPPSITYIAVFRAQFGTLVLKARDTLVNMPAQGLIKRPTITLRP